MEQATPAPQPPVVLRSRYALVRALLGIATIAIVALAVAVVILAGDGSQAGGTSPAQPVPSIEYGGFNPNTGRPESAPLPPAGLAKDYSENSATGDYAPAKPGSGPLPARKLDGATDTPPPTAAPRKGGTDPR
jgi:hypothetical protein